MTETCLIILQNVLYSYNYYYNYNQNYHHYYILWIPSCS